MTHWGGGGCHIWGEGVWLNCHITFMWLKKLNIFTVPLALFSVYVGEWLKTSWGASGWLKTLEYRHMGGEVENCSKKPSYDI